MAGIPVPFSDISKPANDLLTKDFYHVQAANLEVKSKAPNGVTFNVKGKSAHDGPISGSLEGKYVDKATGKGYRIYFNPDTHAISHIQPARFKHIRPQISISTYSRFDYTHLFTHRIAPYYSIHAPLHSLLLTWHPSRFPGLSLTQTWTTANSLDTKLELEDNLTKGLKAEILSNYMPAKSTYGGKLNLHYKQPNFHVRSFVDLFKGPVANVDLTLGHEGFLVGAEGGYDVQKAAITKYSLAAGYSQGSYAAAITATNNLSIFSASYYHKVNTEVEAGAKATWDSAARNNVGLEVASKYKLDPSSFAKAKINDRGIAALAYNVKLGTGVTLGLGASLDTQNLSQAAHKVGASFTFEG